LEQLYRTYIDEKGLGFLRDEGGQLEFASLDVVEELLFAWGEVGRLADKHFIHQNA
jgi:hypothetical protein